MPLKTLREPKFIITHKNCCTSFSLCRRIKPTDKEWHKHVCKARSRTFSYVYECMKCYHLECNNCDIEEKEMIEQSVHGNQLRKQMCTEIQCGVRERDDGLIDCYNCFKKLNVCIQGMKEGISEEEDFLSSTIEKSVDEEEKNGNSKSTKSSRIRTHTDSKCVQNE